VPKDEQSAVINSSIFHSNKADGGNAVTILTVKSTTSAIGDQTDTIFRCFILEAARSGKCSEKAGRHKNIRNYKTIEEDDRDRGELWLGRLSVMELTTKARFSISLS
jgi:hypothetical protein